jgi:hypothetical protein
MAIEITPLIGGLLVLATTLELLRRRQLREKYAVLWLVVSAGIVLLGLVPGLLVWLTSALGFGLPSNLLFFLGTLILLLVSMQLSLEVGRLEDETRRLAEEVALLHADLEELKSGRAGIGRPS